MTPADWELWDGLRRQIEADGARIKELEMRVESMLRERSARQSEADTFGAYPLLHIPDPDPQPLCPDCEKPHSPELPCAPADEAWTVFSKERTA